MMLGPPSDSVHETELWEVHPGDAPAGPVCSPGVPLSSCMVTENFFDDPEQWSAHRQPTSLHHVADDNADRSRGLTVRIALKRLNREILTEARPGGVAGVRAATHSFGRTCGRHVVFG